MTTPPPFTQTLPYNCDGNYRDWFFVWHPPANPELTSDPALRRGTGMPEPAAKLGRYARLNTENQGYPEGWNWHWMPMADFARMMAQDPAQGDTAHHKLFTCDESGTHCVCSIGPLDTVFVGRGKADRLREGAT